jgi:multidrug transporter EmrE-like cation transporter
MNGNIKAKISRPSDHALVRAWFGGLLVAAFGGVAAVNVLGLGSDALGVAFAVLAGAGAVCALVCGFVMSGRAAE